MNPFGCTNAGYWAGAILLSALLATGAFVPSDVSAECPTSYLWYEGGYPTTLPGASLDRIPTSWQAGSACPMVCYDIRAGVLIASGEATPWWASFRGAEAIDEYEISGAPGTEPIALEAQLHVVGSINNPGMVIAAVREDLVESSRYWRDEGAIDAWITLPLEHRPGERFQLMARLFAGGTEQTFAGTAVTTASATLRFSGLPNGAAVISCQGYDLPVPTLTTTWGRVKGLYR